MAAHSWPQNAPTESLRGSAVAAKARGDIAGHNAAMVEIAKREGWVFTPLPVASARATKPNLSDPRLFVALSMFGSSSARALAMENASVRPKAVVTRGLGRVLDEKALKKDVVMFNSRQNPSDQRAFVHKRIIGAATGFLTGGVTGGIGGFFAGGRKKSPENAKFGGPSTNIVAQTGCPAGSRRQGNICVDLSAAFPGGKPFISGATGFQGGGGEVVMGQYGAAMVPGSMIVDRAICLKGMVVGSDGMCYNKSQISNKERMWPRGRRPLLTGGDMRAISIAARASARMTRTAVRLQDLGMIKKPIARRPSKKK